MSPTQRILVAVILSSLPLLLALQCEDGTVALETEFTAAIVMQNSTPDSLHIWTEGEFIGPSNRLAPNASRTLTRIVRTQEAIDFHAGRGALASFDICFVKVGAKETDSFLVVATPVPQTTPDIHCDGSGWKRP